MDSCETVEKLVAYHRTTWPLEPVPSGAQTLIEKGKKGTFDDPFQGEIDHNQIVLKF
jgi:hypothetical protein